MANYREKTQLRSGGDRAIGGFDMSLNDFSRRILATAAAAGDGKVPLHLGERIRATIDYFADLAIADGVTQANVHGREISPWRMPKLLAIM